MVILSSENTAPPPAPSSSRPSLRTTRNARPKPSTPSPPPCHHGGSPCSPDAGLCHGLAGTYQTAFRAAADALTPAIAARLPALATALQAQAATAADAPPGFLTGTTGTRLALETARHGTPRSGWDSCLLLT